MSTEPNLALIVPLAGVALGAVVLLLIGARALGKRRRPWLIEGNPS